MFTPGVIFLMMANGIAAAGAILAARQISIFDVSRKQLTEAKRSEDAAGEAGLVEDRGFRNAA